MFLMCSGSKSTSEEETGNSTGLTKKAASSIADASHSSRVQRKTVVFKGTQSK